VVEYRRTLDEYNKARAKFDAEANTYWSSIAQMRRQRNAKRRAGHEVVLEDYVLTQPPIYSGPPRPIDPSAPGPPPRPPREYVPVVVDFLRYAAEQCNFAPQQPQSEMDYKRAYAKAALAAGLIKQQIVRIYAFESGGNGGYDVQAGLEYPSPHARAINSALGYNQLLNTNSVELLAEKGDRFVEALKAKAAGLSGDAKTALVRKIDVLRRMIAFSRTVPDDWNEHDKLANTPRGFAVHSLILDVDVGPLLQTQKLVDSVHFAQSKGWTAPLTAAELEMMNLTGDGNGLDVVIDAGRHAREGADLELLPARRLRPQPGGEPQQRCGQADRGDQRQDGPRGAAAGRPRHSRRVLERVIPGRRCSRRLESGFAQVCAPK
jgi:hypothetical protein